MPALRIMTLNAQCLPLLAMIHEGQSDVAEPRAQAICDVLTGLPTVESPDVIALNEVFAEDARDVFVKELKSGWPHFVSKVHNGGVLEDSGLMLFSRHPFLDLPNGEKRLELFYQASEDDDAKSQKAVTIVQIGVPHDRTTIAFTHMQASYATEDQYSDIRTSQFSEMNDAILKVMNGEDGPWGQVVLLGDLNVRGDADAVSGEWLMHFEPPSEVPFDRLLDGWASYMHEPGNPAPKDFGLTNIDMSNGTQQRLDYICTARPERHDITLKPQHMRIRLRGLSDHYALEAVIQRASDHCTPSDARDLLAIPPNSGGSGDFPTEVRSTTATFQFEGSWHWFFVREPGTYSVWVGAGITAEFYLESNFSEPVSRLDRINFSELDPTFQGGFRTQSIDREGETFVTREPFFIAVRRADGKAGASPVVVVQHRGESSATAIGLLPHEMTPSSFPIGQRLGKDDLCWFKAVMPRTLSGDERQEPFEVHNGTGVDITATLQDAAKQELKAVDGAQAQLDLAATAKGEELIYLILGRSTDTVNGFEVIWTSPICYLDLNENIYLFVNDETGIDGGGADEPELRVWVDNFKVFDDVWDDADTGEWWPGLVDAIRARCASRLPGVRRVGFARAITVEVFDPDIAATGVFPTANFLPLVPADRDKAQRVKSLTIPDDVFADGLYTVGLTLSRFP